MLAYTSLTIWEASIQPVQHVPALWFFRDLCSLLVFRLKVSEEQPPGFLQKIQGVFIQIEADTVAVKPDPNRLGKLWNIIRQARKADRLSAEAAARLAGKLQFLCASFFGRVGQPLLHPLRLRAKSTADTTEALNSGLRSALRCLLSLLLEAPPKVLPLRFQEVAYGSHHRCKNSLAFVRKRIRPEQLLHFSAPPYLLQVYCHRKAFI